MPTLASEVMQVAAGKLNDPLQTLYTNTVLLPYLKTAYTDLQTELQNNSVPVFSEISAIISLPAGTIMLDTETVPPLPADFVQPIKLFERRTGTEDTFAPMTEKAWEPEIRPGDTLIYWVWRENQLHFMGSTADRDIKIRYMKSWAELVGNSSPIAQPRLRSYLESKTAAYAARYIGQNATRAGQLEADAGRFLLTQINIMTKNRQALPVRRQGYGAHKRRSRVWPSR